MEIDFKRITDALEKRFDLEARYYTRIKALILEAFRRIMRAVPKNMSAARFTIDRCATKREIRKILEWLYDCLCEEMEAICEAVIRQREECYGVTATIDAEDILAAEYGGKDTYDKIRAYRDNLADEFESWAVIMLHNKFTPEQTARLYSANITMPYNNKLFNGASAIAGVSVMRVRLGAPHWGIGIYAAGYSSLNRMVRNVASNTARQTDWNIFSQSGVIGWEVVRGSSFPCEECDDNVGFHAAAFADLPPYHANCKCIAIPVTI